MEFRKLKAEEIDCRVAQIAANYCTLLLYKDARVDQKILDESVGCMNWQKRYVRDNANCIVGIWDEEKKQWVEKEDTGTESFTEQEKGLASDSFKRACFNWGIGRELYTAPSIFIFPRKDMGSITKPDEDSKEFFQNVNGKYTTKTRFYVDIIGYDNEGNINNLIIRDHKGNLRFEKLTKEYEKEKNKQFLELKKLIEENEEDDKFNREDFYKNFEVSADSQLNHKQTEEAIRLLKERLKKVK